MKAGLPTQGTMEKFKCLYCKKSYVFKKSLIAHEKRDHVEGKKVIPTGKPKSSIRLPEDREVESMMKSRKKIIFPPLTNILDKINMVSIKKPNKSTGENYGLKKSREKDDIEENRDVDKARPHKGHDLEDEVAQDRYAEVGSKIKRRKFEYETGRFKTPYREKEKQTFSEDIDGSKSCPDTTLRMKTSQQREEASQDRLEMSHQRSGGSQDRSERSSESVGIQMKRKFPGLTDENFKIACLAALEKRQKIFPSAKSVQRREIESEITKNMEIIKETFKEDQMEVEDDDRDFSNSHACKSCGKAYLKIANLMKHIQKEHQIEVVNQFKCSICEKVMKTKKTLKKHVKIHTDSTCEQCGEMVSSKHRLKHHIRKEHEVLVCNKCPYTGTFKEVEAHQHSKHRSGKSEVNKTCPKCFKVFTSRTGWLYHKKSHDKLEMLEGTNESEEEVKTPVEINPTKGKKQEKKGASTGQNKVRKPTIQPAPLSEYEQIRAKNIEEKEAGLKRLGLSQSTSTSAAVPPPCPTQHYSPTSVIQVSGLKTASKYQSFSVARTQIQDDE